MVTTGQVIVSGEIKSSAYVNIQKVVREQIKKIGYDNSELMFDYKSCGILTYINEQSEDISRGVEKVSPEDQGAGDQGIMFGYATDETKNFIPIGLDLSHKILKELALLRKEGNKIKYLRPDSKCQVTVEYEKPNFPKKIKSITVAALLKTDLQPILNFFGENIHPIIETGITYSLGWQEDYAGGLGVVVGGTFDNWIENSPLGIRIFGNGYMIPSPDDALTGFGNIGVSILLSLKRSD